MCVGGRAPFFSDLKIRKFENSKFRNSNSSGTTCVAAAVAAAVAVAMAMGMGIGIGNVDEEGDGDEDEPSCAPLFPILKSKIGTIEIQIDAGSFVRDECVFGCVRQMVQVTSDPHA